MQIYMEYGYSEREATAEIVKNNLYGIDIDSRAVQLAYFAVMMKARQYDRRFFFRGIQPHIYEITESNTVDKTSIDYFCGCDSELKKDIWNLLDTLKDAKEYGSILQIPVVNFGKINERFAQLSKEISIYKTYLLGDFRKMIIPAEIISRKYAVVATNPPYLNKYDSKLKEYIFSKYANYKGDLFSVFMYRNFFFCKSGGYSCFMTPMVWMFIQTYEKLRRYILDNKGISTLIQMEYSAYEEATVPICTFVLKNHKDEGNGCYFKLSNFTGGMDVQRRKVLEAINSSECNYYYETPQQKYEAVPSTPIAFWVSDSVFNAFSNSCGSVKDFSNGEGKNVTTNNAKYILFYWEVSCTDIGAFDYKWLPCAMGGDYRKWYGNIVNVIDWSESTRAFYKRAPAGRIIREEFWPMTGITWGKISSAASSFRVLGKYQMYQETAILQRDETKTAPILALLNSCVSGEFLKFLSPTINFQLQDICAIPIMDNILDNKEICDLSVTCIEIAKEDWDSYEISMNFKEHPFITFAQCNAKSGESITVKSAFENWQSISEGRFHKLKSSEEELNRIFIDIYGLQDELSPELEDKEVSIRKADLQREVRSFISFAVGCMFGRYALGKPGLIYAGGDWDSSAYSQFQPDRDAIIPICDDEYFEDDIVGDFVRFVEIAFGKLMLEENLRFIADALGGKGSSREVIRSYFINDFYADHLKVYQKRPIYWLFDSGKKNGFKCLIYMHRYQPDTIARIRTDYVHEQQSRYRTAIADLEQRISGASSTERVKLSKQLAKLQTQAEEIRVYEEKIHHLADQMIKIDLDDGVKHNYAIFKDVLAKIK